MKILIGIDPGVNTGFAVSKNGNLVKVSSMTITQAMKEISHILMYKPEKIKIYIEDARKRKWFGKNSNAKQQGAGSIKRDCSIWDDYLSETGIDFELVDPKHQKGATKKTADEFKQLTGWQGRTNEHGRDAAMLIFDR